MCATEAIQHPGWTARLLSVEEAVNLVRGIILTKKDPNFVIGVAGPGDPLANNQTFEALSLIHQEYPRMLKCICTNGLLLEDRLSEIEACGIRAVTVTVNATSGDVGKDVYSWVRYNRVTYYGKEAASFLISKQISGLKKAVDRGFSVKVNTVLIPGINDREMPRIARRVKEIGVSVMNIMPLIPCGKMKKLRVPTCEEIRKARWDCEGIIPQFRRCEQCRADVIYLPY
jgi:nitrogen fixation protein NifB